MIKWDLGATFAADIINEKGKPEDEGFFAGAYYIAYGDNLYFTDASHQDVQQGNYGLVTEISFAKGEELLGVKIGMTLDEIKGKLGEPDRIFLTDEDNEFFSDSKCISYVEGNLNNAIYLKKSCNLPENMQW